MTDTQKAEAKPNWTVETNSLGCVWIEDEHGETVCDFYHRFRNHRHIRPDQPTDFCIKPDAAENAKLIIEAFERVEALEVENAKLRIEKDAAENHACAALEKAKELEAENAKLREAARDATTVIDAYVQGFGEIQTADGIDAADTYMALTALLQGGE